MKTVRVIQAGGASLAGPMKLKLSKDQHARRAHILGPHNKKGVYVLDGGQNVTFKEGEELGVESLSKVSRGAFEEVGNGPVTAPEPGTGKGAVSADAAGPDGADAADIDAAGADDEGAAE